MNNHEGIKKIKSKEIKNYLEVFTKDSKIIEIIKMQAKSDEIWSCELKGSYNLLEYDIEPNITYENSYYPHYRLVGNKVLFKGYNSVPKETVKKSDLNMTFNDLIRYIEKMNDQIKLYKNYHETTEKNK